MVEGQRSHQILEKVASSNQHFVKDMKISKATEMGLKEAIDCSKSSLMDKYLTN